MCALLCMREADTGTRNSKSYAGGTVSGLEAAQRCCSAPAPYREQPFTSLWDNGECSSALLTPLRAMAVLGVGGLLSAAAARAVQERQPFNSACRLEPIPALRKTRPETSTGSARSISFVSVSAKANVVLVRQVRLTGHFETARKLRSRSPRVCRRPTNSNPPSKYGGGSLTKRGRTCFMWVPYQARTRRPTRFSGCGPTWVGRDFTRDMAWNDRNGGGHPRRADRPSSSASFATIH
jgi:hypothetical protein